MSAIQKIAYYQGIRSEVPNQVLARELFNTRDVSGIQEIVNGLDQKEQSVCSDCLKVLYEIGYLDPTLIAPHVNRFLTLVNSKDNRMVWGAFIALATVASLKSDEISIQIPTLIEVFNKGSVITVVWGMRLFASLAAASSHHARILIPIMLHTLKTCLPRDIPTHAESMLPCISLDERDLVLEVLRSRFPQMSPAQAARCKKVVRKIESLNLI